MGKDPNELKQLPSTAADVPPPAVHDAALVDELIGTTYLSKYELLDVLGVGGMGVIYLGRQIFLDRMVAIKMLKNNLASVKQRTRFHQEAKAACALKHPGIVAILDFGVDELDRPYMVMEHVEGCTISDLLDERLTLPMEDILPVFLEICDALAEAHKKGIVHRDLKPSNIMLVIDDDGDPHIKILDFGIAKMLDHEDRTFQDLTRTGDALGTPLYMSPEQVRGRDVTYKSDLYSIGCMLYACLTGTPPFVGENKMTTMDMHLTEKPASLSEASDGLDFPQGVEGIVMRLLEKKPESRFESAEELKKALLEMAARNGFLPDAVGGSPLTQAGNPLTQAGNPPKHGGNPLTQPANPLPRGGNETRSGRTDRSVSDTDSVEFQKRMERNANTVYWNSDLSERVKSARSDKPRSLPRRSESYAVNEESAPSEHEAALKKTFVIAGAVIGLILLIGAGVLFVGWHTQSARQAQAGADSSRPEAVTTISASGATGPATSAPASAKQSAGGNTGSSASNAVSGAGPNTGSSAANAVSGADAGSDSASNTAITSNQGRDSKAADSVEPEFKERTGDDIIKDKLSAGAYDSSMSFKEQEGLTATGLQFLPRFKLLRNLDLRGTNLKPDDAKYFVETPITTLSLDVNRGITDESLSSISKMKNLQYLSLAATGVSDEGMKRIRTCPTLMSLWIGCNSRITDGAVKNLDPDTSPLRSLFLNKCSITDAAAPYLARFKYMFSLDLEGNPQIGDRTVEIIQGKANGLQCLVLANDKKIGDAGIHALTKYKGLRVLDLSGIKLSQAAQSDLCKMTDLSNLYLVDCQLTPYEISKLCKALPSTTVETNNRLKSKLL